MNMDKPLLFTKRPLTVEAWRVPLVIQREAGDGNTSRMVANWCGGTIVSSGIMVRTSGGVTLARPGDWIIKGVANDFYPCPPGIFDMTYTMLDPTE